jgi:hypothetical protein
VNSRPRSSFTIVAANLEPLDCGGAGSRPRRAQSLHLLPSRRTTHADYEHRALICAWAERWYSPQLEQRGIFRQSFLRTLMERHLSGREEWLIGKIAPVITYEMMLRRFYD